MPTKKIDTPIPWKQPKICRHPDHNVPNMIVLEPGTYEHTCPGCGNVIRFVVPEKPTL